MLIMEKTLFLSCEENIADSIFKKMGSEMIWEKKDSNSSKTTRVKNVIDMYFGRKAGRREILWSHQLNWITKKLFDLLLRESSSLIICFLIKQVWADLASTKGKPTR